MALGVVPSFCSPMTSPASSSMQYQLERSPKSNPIVSFLCRFLSLAVAAAGTVHGGKTTPLMTLDEGVASFKKAATSTYQPPSS